MPAHRTAFQTDATTHVATASRASSPTSPTILKSTETALICEAKAGITTKTRTTNPTDAKSRTRRLTGPTLR